MLIKLVLVELSTNLIGNSIKFIPRKGIISIVFERKRLTRDNKDIKEIVVVSIKDAGLGIETEIFPKLFKVYYYLISGNGIRPFYLKKHS